MSSYLGAGMGRVRLGGGPTEGPAQQRERIIEGGGAGDLEGLTRGPRAGPEEPGEVEGHSEAGLYPENNRKFHTGSGVFRSGFGTEFSDVGRPVRRWG